MGVPVGLPVPAKVERGGGKTLRRSIQMAVISMKTLLETGVHFGHRTRKWNPRMKQYIFTERNGIHIIDLQQTLDAFEVAYALIREKTAEGGSLLFVGTKRQAQETIELEASRCGMPFVNSRWLGGTLTNWRTIRSRITELENLEKRRDEGEFELLTKKEALNMRRNIDRLEERLGGIRNMKGLPSLIYVVDVRREETAIHEANLLGIPVVALVDTNCDPSGVDYVIPSNDDAIRAIKLLTAGIADAVLEGKALRKDFEEETEVVEEALPQYADLDLTDEELLGEATLAKLKSGEYDERGRLRLEDESDIEEDVEDEDEFKGEDVPDDADQSEVNAEEAEVSSAKENPEVDLEEDIVLDAGTEEEEE
jgi:small subunit ribosomal protein S2